MQKACSLNNHKHFFLFYYLIFLLIQSQTNIITLIRKSFPYFFNSFRLVFFVCVNQHLWKFWIFRVFQSFQLLCQKLDVPYLWTSFLELNERQFLDYCRILLIWQVLLEIDVHNIDYWLQLDGLVDLLANFELKKNRKNLRMLWHLKAS